MKFHLPAETNARRNVRSCAPYIIFFFIIIFFFFIIIIFFLLILACASIGLLVETDVESEDRTVAALALTKLQEETAMMIAAIATFFIMISLGSESGARIFEGRNDVVDTLIKKNPVRIQQTFR